MNCGISYVYLWFIFSMVFTGGSGASGQDRPELTDDQIREMIAVEVAIVFRGSILELFGSIKTALSYLMIVMLHSLWLLLLQLPRALLLRGFEGRDLSSTGISTIRSPLEFDGARDPIVVIRWPSDVEGLLVYEVYLCDQVKRSKGWYTINKQ